MELRTLPSISQASLVLFGLTLLITSLGFRRVVYFVSVGYAFGIAAMALVTVLIFRQNISPVALLHNLLLLFWGLRLGIFLLQRELQPSFQNPSRQVTDQYAGVSMPRRFVIWLGVSVLYVLMYLPGLFGAASFLIKMHAYSLVAQIAGLLLMTSGLIIEALADRQKLIFKSRYPKMFCDVGLYRLVRCPNYLGEILFWIGNWVMGIPYYATPVHWAASLIGLICLILIMLGSTRRLERDQGRRYGNLPEYQTYIQTVPVLIPFVPVYTLKNIRVYLE